MKRAIAILMLSSALAGCGVMYQKAADEFVRTQPESSWGPPPPTGHTAVERAYILDRLKDPSSAEIRFYDLQRMVIPAGIADPKIAPVWVSSAMVNAKNSFGGYTGAKRWSFYWRDGLIFAVDEESGVRRYLR